VRLPCLREFGELRHTISPSMSCCRQGMRELLPDRLPGLTARLLRQRYHRFSLQVIIWNDREVISKIGVDPAWHCAPPEYLVQAGQPHMAAWWGGC
jgi:hypothetical protein